ncbi:MAG: hypothetical protein QXM73_01725 [Candidatus Nezhaarchaeales archaeon]
MSKKVLYGIAIAAVALLLLVSVGGALATTYAQNTNAEGQITQQIKAPFGFKLVGWLNFRHKLGPLRGTIQISSEYNETVMNILSTNSDARSLLDQGYRVVSMRPLVTAYVQGDGTVSFKAEKAVVILSNGNVVVAYIVDVVSRSVTHIATINVGTIKELSGFNCICRP